MYSLMKKMLMILVLSALVLAGCSSPSQPQEPSADEETPSESVELPEEPEQEAPSSDDAADSVELPETVTSSILIEGMEEEMNLYLFRDESLPFFTYYPEDLVAEKVVGDDLQGVRFVTNYGGIQNPEAYVAILFYSPEAINSEDDFLERITGESGILTRREVEWIEKSEPEELMYDWTIREYFYMSDTYSGAVYAGIHQGQHFLIDIHYPWEFGDGLEARAYLILQSFTWLADGTSLNP